VLKRREGYGFLSMSERGDFVQRIVEGLIIGVGVFLIIKMMGGMRNGSQA